MMAGGEPQKEPARCGHISNELLYAFGFNGLIQ